MNTKRSITVFGLLLILAGVMAQPAWAGSSGSNQTTTDPKEYTAEDANWPITSIEYKVLDDGTGVEIVMRVAPPSYPIPPWWVQKLQCIGFLKTKGIGALASGCVYREARSLTYTATAKKTDTNKLTQKLTTYANLYCWKANCSGDANTLYGLYKDVVKWTRSNTSWTAKNALHQWGCFTTCTTCNGSTTRKSYSYTIGTVTWASSTASKVYTYNYYFFAVTSETPALQGYNCEWVSSYGYYNGVKFKYLKVSGCWI